MKKSFDQEILEHKALLFRLALSMLHNRHDAEDALSGFYLRVLEKREQFAGYDNLKGALIRGMKNYCLNVCKSRKTFEAKDQVPLTSDVNSNQPLFDDHKLQLIQQIIGDLPEKQRIMVQLRMVEGLTMARIAEIMEVKVNTVEMSISRARKKIRAEYEKRRS